MSADGLVVRGGPGGTTVALDQLSTAATELVATGVRLAWQARRLAGIAASPSLLATGVLGPGTLAVAQARLVAAEAGLVAGAARVGALGVAVGSAVQLYRQGEQAADRAVAAAGLGVGSALGAVLGPAVPLAVPVALLATLAPGGDAGLPALAPDRLQWVLSVVPALVAGAVGRPPGAGPAWAPGAGAGLPRSVRSPLGALAVLGEAVPVLRESRTPVVTVGAATPVRPPADLAELLDRIDSGCPGAGNGSCPVVLQTVTRADGSRAWLVLIPGIQSWSPRPGQQPFDLTGAVRTLGGRHSDAAATVRVALDRAGARPGEPVLLAGHSMGGMVAAELAADPGFRRRYRVEQVVTAGSPVAGYPIPDRVPVLSLEHDDDPVPALDGAVNPDRLRWVTASRASAATGPGLTPSAHDLDRYLVTAREVQRSPDPGLVAGVDRLRPFLDAPGARAESRTATGVRP